MDYHQAKFRSSKVKNKFLEVRALLEPNIPFILDEVGKIFYCVVEKYTILAPLNQLGLEVLISCFVDKSGHENTDELQHDIESYLGFC